MYFHMVGQSKHFKKLAGVFADFRKDDVGFGIGCGINNSEKDRNTDTVNDLSVPEIDHEGLATRFDLTPAFPFDLFAADLVQIITGKNGGCFTLGANRYV